jgi:hypothetical protein
LLGKGTQDAKANFAILQVDEAGQITERLLWLLQEFWPHVRAETWQAGSGKHRFIENVKATIRKNSGSHNGRLTVGESDFLTRDVGGTSADTRIQTVAATGPRGGRPDRVGDSNGRAKYAHHFEHPMKEGPDSGTERSASKSEFGPFKKSEIQHREWHARFGPGQRGEGRESDAQQFGA